ncbi:MAG: dUTP diphosphatase [Deltaproteobacteria bacterium]|nr:dUTP diphosphatase [Deltaproteobacteria bacterium]MBW1983084.1 dUTP diphosphatase [Deltaproteobacteria bacterium]MBW2178853.1 dUTP diphosphatase [Deltaproteobacteria bacterium]
MAQPLVIQLRRIHPDKDSDIPLPRYMTPQSAGMDLCAAIENDIHLNHGDIVLVPTGFAMSIPEGYEGQIRPRSGIAVKHGISIVNSPGTIDSDYRGEVKIAVIHMGKKAYILHRGDRIAQMIIKKVYQAKLEVVEALEETERNAGGFGHTGN